jgi:hypothetical protein
MRDQSKPGAVVASNIRLGIFNQLIMVVAYCPFYSTCFCAHGLGCAEVRQMYEIFFSVFEPS